LTKTTLTTIALLSALSASSLIGQVDEKNARETLAGLRGVHIAIGPVDEGAQQHGVSEAQIRTDVELQLKQAGVVVLTKDDLRRVPGMPLLYVSAGVAPPEGISTAYAYHVQVEVFQLIVLTRNPDVFALARTWNAKGGLGAVGAKGLGTSVKESVREMTDQFVAAYTAANPKH